MDADQASTEARGACPGCAALEARLAESEQRIRQLERLLDELRRGGKRQAAPFSKGPPKLNPKPPGRKAGDDYGTKAYRAVPKVIDEEHEAPLPDRCPRCGGSRITPESVEHQYQTEIPTRPIHRQFNVAIGHCACCGKRVQGRHPLQTSDALGCAASQLGPDAQALIVHLNKEAGLSQGKISRFFKTCFGIDLTRGGSCQSMLRAARRCEGHAGRIVAHIRASPSVTPDETGWRIGGTSAWLHAAVTGDAAAYLIHRQRGFGAARLLLGDGYGGTLIHDGWAAYDRFVCATHQTCLAHLLRRCREMVEVATRGAAVFPRKIKAILKQALAVRDRRDAGLIAAATARRKAGQLQQQIVTLTAPTKTHPANERLAAHLYRHQRHLFTFLRHEGIDATNWRAEQALRPVVVNRKVWGGNRTWRGAATQGRVMSLLRTAQQHGTDAIDYLAALARAPTIDAVPHLLT
jgi:transposase